MAEQTLIRQRPGVGLSVGLSALLGDCPDSFEIRISDKNMMMVGRSELCRRLIQLESFVQHATQHGFRVGSYRDECHRDHVTTFDRI